MQGSLDDPPIFIVGSLWKSMLVSAGGLCFVLLGFFLLRVPGDRLISILCIGFFGFCTVAALIGVVRPNSVELNPEGIVISSALKSNGFPWRSVSGFRIVKVRRQQFIGFDLSSDYAGFEALRRTNRAIAGIDASLPTLLEISPEKTLSLVCAAKKKWGS